VSPDAAHYPERGATEGRVSKNRLEAFSDGVIAIIITIMVLGLAPPKGALLSDLQGLGPVFVSYVLSFVNVGIYWNNHHHLLQATRAVSGGVLWANMHLLFWLSLFPFATGWMGENDFAPVPVAVYGVVCLLAGFAYYLLERALIRVQPEGASLGDAIGADRKGLASLAIFAVAIPIALVAPALAFALYVLVAVMWFIPDRRIERALGR
jgi:uncharacterized membrane protein